MTQLEAAIMGAIAGVVMTAWSAFALAVIARLALGWPASVPLTLGIAAVALVAGAAAAVGVYRSDRMA